MSFKVNLINGTIKISAPCDMKLYQIKYHAYKRFTFHLLPHELAHSLSIINVSLKRTDCKSAQNYSDQRRFLKQKKTKIMGKKDW